MKKAVLFSFIVIFSSSVLAAKDFVSEKINFIVQNTSNNNLIVYYYICTDFIKLCSMEKAFPLNAKTSDFNTPIVIIFNKIRGWQRDTAEFVITKVYNLSNGTEQHFPPYSCQQDASFVSTDPQYPLITLDSLVDQPSVITCTPGHINP